MIAVIRTGGKQYKVSEGDILEVELLKTTDSKATISDVLLVANGSDVKIGKPALAGALVTLELVEEIKAPKVVAFKYRRREGYHRTVGHRQKLSRVKVTSIAL
jgi:large subunit ribosomal protein L21